MRPLEALAEYTMHMTSTTMRFAFATLFLITTQASTAFAQEAPSRVDLTPIGQASGETRFAPADVTFGHFHLSIMGISNELRMAGGRFDDYSEREELETGPFMYVVDAIRDWERKYPNDPGIPRELLAVVRTYDRVHTVVGRELAERAAVWLEHDYPASASAESLRRESP